MYSHTKHKSRTFVCAYKIFFNREIRTPLYSSSQRVTGGPKPRKSGGTQLTFSKSMRVAYWRQSNRWGSLSPQRNPAGGELTRTLRCLKCWRFLPPGLRGFASPPTRSVVLERPNQFKRPTGRFLMWRQGKTPTLNGKLNLATFPAFRLAFEAAIVSKSGKYRRLSPGK